MAEHVKDVSDGWRSYTISELMIMNLNIIQVFMPKHICMERGDTPRHQICCKTIFPCPAAA